MQYKTRLKLSTSLRSFQSEEVVVRFMKQDYIGHLENALGVGIFLQKKTLYHLIIGGAINDMAWTKLDGFLSVAIKGQTPILVAFQLLLFTGR